MQKGTNIIDTDASYSNKVNDTINSIFSFENLYNAYLKCLKGVKWKYSVQNYMLNACFRIARLRKRLINKTYQLGATHVVDVYKNSHKQIIALSFEDRIVVRCIFDNVLINKIRKDLIYDCGATLENKGLQFTEKRINCHLNNYYKKYGNKGYVIKLDIYHYFESISYDILYHMLKKYAQNDYILSLMMIYIKLASKGLNLGNPISQICGLLYLNSIDHFIKDKLKIKYYGRYMDDMYIICNKPKNYLKLIDLELQKLGLKLNKHKTHIFKLSDSFVFCKTRYKLLENGKILRLITGDSFKRMKRKIKKGINLTTVLPSWNAYISKFNIYNKYKLFYNNYIRKEYCDEIL